MVKVGEVGGCMSGLAYEKPLLVALVVGCLDLSINRPRKLSSHLANSSVEGQFSARAS